MPPDPAADCKLAGQTEDGHSTFNWDGSITAKEIRSALASIEAKLDAVVQAGQQGKRVPSFQPKAAPRPPTTPAAQPGGPPNTPPQAALPGSAFDSVAENRDQNAEAAVVAQSLSESPSKEEGEEGDASKALGAARVGEAWVEAAEGASPKDKTSVRLSHSFSGVSADPSSRLSWDFGHVTSSAEKWAKKFGLTNVLVFLEKVMEDIDEQHGRLHAFVHTSNFQLGVSVVILMHAFLTGYNASVSFDIAANGAPEQTWMDVLEIAFCVFFIVELALRVISERLAFFIGTEWRWNAFDTILIGLSLSDIFMNGMHSGQVACVTVARILRLSRFFRLMRISRVMRRLSSLRTILFALVDSLTSLIWCFLFIGFLIYIFAVLIVYGAAEYFNIPDEAEAPSGPGQHHDSKEAIRHWWGGIYRSMVTLFMAITGGADWSDLVESLKEIHFIYEPLFIFYIFFMVFGVLNVVVGAFVATTSAIAAEDKEALVKYEMDRLEKYTQRIKKFFKEADIDKSGTLSWEEFRNHLDDSKVKAYFQALELDVSQAHVLFDLLDTDGSNQVNVEEFLDGCMRLKGPARNIELNMLLTMCQKVFEQLVSFMTVTDGRLGDVVYSLGLEDPNSLNQIGGNLAAGWEPNRCSTPSMGGK